VAPNSQVKLTVTPKGEAAQRRNDLPGKLCETFSVDVTDQDATDRVHTVESRIGPTRGFGFTPGERLTKSQPRPYPKSEKPPSAQMVLEPKSLKSPR